jgi:hypothetical protein
MVDVLLSAALEELLIAVLVMLSLAADADPIIDKTLIAINNIKNIFMFFIFLLHLHIFFK